MKTKTRGFMGGDFLLTTYKPPPAPSVCRESNRVGSVCTFPARHKARCDPDIALLTGPPEETVILKIAPASVLTSRKKRRLRGYCNQVKYVPPRYRYYALKAPTDDDQLQDVISCPETQPHTRLRYHRGLLCKTSHRLQSCIM